MLLPICKTAAKNFKSVNWRRVKTTQTCDTNMSKHERKHRMMEQENVSSWEIHFELSYVLIWNSWWHVIMVISALLF